MTRLEQQPEKQPSPRPPSPARTSGAQSAVIDIEVCERCKASTLENPCALHQQEVFYVPHAADVGSLFEFLGKEEENLIAGNLESDAGSNLHHRQSIYDTDCAPVKVETTGHSASEAAESLFSFLSTPHGGKENFTGEDAKLKSASDCEESDSEEADSEGDGSEEDESEEADSEEEERESDDEYEEERKPRPRARVNGSQSKRKVTSKYLGVVSLHFVSIGIQLYKYEYRLHIHLPRFRKFVKCKFVVYSPNFAACAFFFSLSLFLAEDQTTITLFISQTC
jgi:hypothetical protein